MPVHTSAMMAPSVTMGRQCMASGLWPGRSSGIEGAPFDGVARSARGTSPHSGQVASPAAMRSRQTVQRTAPCPLAEVRELAGTPLEARALAAGGAAAAPA